MSFYARELSTLEGDDQWDKFSYYCKLIFLLTLVLCCTEGLTRALIINGSAQAQTTIHKRLIDKVFAAPMNMYFEVTSIGTILNRFTKDMGVVDKEIFLDF